MAEVHISAEARSEFGKGAARRLRRAHKVPGVLYGHGNEPRHISLPGHDLMLALKNPNVLLHLKLDGTEEELALPKDVQRDPIRGFLEHVDLLLVRKGEKVKVDVPLHVIGQAVPEALVVTELNTLEVFAEATNIPAGFDVSIEGRPIGSQILAKEVDLPEGVELAIDAEHLVVNIIAAPTEAELEAELEEAEAEAGIEREESDAEIAEAAAEAEAEAEAEGGEGEAPTDEDEKSE